MIGDLRNRFRASFIMSDAAMPITSVAELLADVQSRPAWDGASIWPVDADYPRCEGQVQREAWEHANPRRR